LAVVVAVAVADAEAEAEGDGVDVAADDELADGEAEGVGVGVADGEGVAVLEVGEVEAVGLVVGEGLEVALTATVSHCCPDEVATAASARAGEAAAAAANATADTPVTKTPPASRLVATGRTRVKHMDGVLPVLFVAYSERSITWSGYIYCQSVSYPYIRHHHGPRAPPSWG
jgi:hypothetical protein